MILAGLTRTEHGEHGPAFVSIPLAAAPAHHTGPTQEQLEVIERFGGVRRGDAVGDPELRGGIRGDVH